MGAGRRVACPSCGDPLAIAPDAMDVFEQGNVQCHRCRGSLVADVLFAQLTSDDALTQIQLTSTWWEADQLEVRVVVGNWSG